MVDIHPFQGVYYNQSLIEDLAAVICPPYDIISPRMQQDLYQKSEYNFVRVEFGRELPQDKDGDNRYTRSAATLKEWLERGILIIGEKPAIYLHDHHFTCQGKEYRRRGIFCKVKLEEWSKMVVRPHEGTLAEPKGDRLNLLWALRANTSPVLALYQDSAGSITELLERQSQSEPVFDITMDGGDRHRMRAITDKQAVSWICSSLAGQPVYIADGHHRYESALAYQREQRAYSSSVKGEEQFDFVMMDLVEFADLGLVILPAHRLIRGMSKSKLEGMIIGLKTFFRVEDIPLDTDNTGKQLNSLLSDEAGQVKLLLYGLEKERILLLRLEDFNTVSQMMPYFHSAIYKRLDVSIIDHVILEELLGLSHDEAGSFLAYSHDGLEAIKRVRDREYQMVFIVNPVKPEVVKAVADCGDRMPRKSTYFYPKVPSGLVFYRFG